MDESISIIANWNLGLAFCLHANEIQIISTISIATDVSHFNLRMSLIRRPVRQENNAAFLTTGIEHSVAYILLTSSNVRLCFTGVVHEMFPKAGKIICQPSLTVCLCQDLLEHIPIG